MDVFEFSLVIKTDFRIWGEPMSSLSLSFEEPAVSGSQSEDKKWIVEVDGVDRTIPGGEKFYSTGPGVTFSNLPGLGATVRLTTYSFVNLPVKLNHFEARSEGNTSLLSWSTTEEINSEYFAIEHSLDARNWKEVGRLRSSGESREPRDYTFNHTAPMGSNYYRLKMVDLDETFAYSQIAKVKIGDQAGEFVYPNPVSNKIELSNGGLENVAKVRIFDVSGKLVYESSQIDKSGIGVGHLAPGILFVEMEKADGNLRKHRVFKK